VSTYKDREKVWARGGVDLRERKRERERERERERNWVESELPKRSRFALGFGD
jgi:hypothetical protein